MKTTVINIKDKDRFQIPKGERNAVLFTYIMRPGPWGNPFKLPHRANDATREVVIDKYRQYLRERPDMIAKARRELKGRVLVCACKPKACHGDVLAAVAEGEDP